MIIKVVNNLGTILYTILFGKAVGQGQIWKSLLYFKKTTL